MKLQEKRTTPERLRATDTLGLQLEEVVSVRDMLKPYWSELVGQAVDQMKRLDFDGYFIPYLVELFPERTEEVLTALRAALGLRVRLNNVNRLLTYLAIMKTQSGCVSGQGQRIH